MTDHDEEFARLQRHVDRLVHVARLGSDSMTLLLRCWDEGDLPPDLAVDVGNFLLRIQNTKVPHEH